MNIVRILYLSLILISFLTSGNLTGQSIYNASFEGEPTMHEPPPGWGPCKYNSTPDTQPGVFYNHVPASDGNTYLAMVTRGNGGENMNSTESCGTSLSESLNVGSCYRLQADLHMSLTSGHFADWLNGNWQSYAMPVMLKIWGGRYDCSADELLAEIGPITNTSWETYDIGFSIDQDGLQYLTLEVDWVGQDPYFGNMMIDNLRLQRFDVNVNLGPDETLCTNETRLLDASIDGATDYLWQDGSANASFEVSEPGTYWVEVSNNDCKNSDTVVISYEDCVRCNMFVQGLFVPNSDVPILYPKADCEILEFNFEVFNTAGNLIYKTNDFSRGWDGKAGIVDVVTGLYLYRITYYAEDWGELKTQLKKGKIMVFNVD